jgi:hypothetical protein
MHVLCMIPIPLTESKAGGNGQVSDCVGQARSFASGDPRDRAGPQKQSAREAGRVNELDSPPFLLTQDPED